MLDQINRSKVPQHIAIIMDGNGRWAKKQNQERLWGHAAGVESVREALKAASEVGVQYLTVYAFSTENWNRPTEEVEGLMELLVQTIANEVEQLQKDDVRLLSIGNTKGLPHNCQIELENAKKATAHNTRISLVLALNYSSKWEILNAVQHLAKQVETKAISAADITEELFEEFLCTVGIPDPELLIRTSGECRISNFLLWQIAYTELVFIEKFWPDFKQEDLYRAIIDFQSRQRRFGKIESQLNV